MLEFGEPPVLQRHQHGQGLQYRGQSRPQDPAAAEHTVFDSTEFGVRDPIIALIVIVFVYVIAKVRYYMKQSEQQWLEVDKSKLKEWDDEED